MKPQTLLALAFASVAFPTPTLSKAVPLPRFDVAKWCDHGGAISHTTTVYSYCVKQEEDAYEASKLYWSEVSPAAQAICVRLATDSRGAQYDMLRTCLHARHTQEGDSQPREFHY